LAKPSKFDRQCHVKELLTAKLDKIAPSAYVASHVTGFQLIVFNFIVRYYNIGPMGGIVQHEWASVILLQVPSAECK